ncbi:cora-domain-containing protein [Microthyrium microscopicum]|uniref:Magnesium transporter n=1 Tax=Microthyrium microscopicum TaxID=703497 RepID=A0A6A6UB90_9PEZI|nr:cora-domain-containing protein [Microthyrium microscopicum]
MNLVAPLSRSAPSPHLLSFLRRVASCEKSSATALQSRSCPFRRQITTQTSRRCRPTALTTSPGSALNAHRIRSSRSPQFSLSSSSEKQFSSSSPFGYQRNSSSLAKRPRIIPNTLNNHGILRPFSSSVISSFWGWWTKHSSARSKRLPPLASFLDGSTPRLVLKATNEPRLRCTEFDENGKVTLVNGEFKKSELIAKYGLLPRDLRKIDSSLLPHILIRPSAILINLLHLRVLIKHNRVLVFDAYGSTDSYTQSVFMYDLEGKLRQIDSRANGSLPYELRALEAVLISVTNALESEFEGVREPVVTVLRELEEDIDREKLRYLLIYSKKLGTFEQTARLVRDALEELLEADDDLAAMYLTAKAEGKERDETEHAEVELLLESYHKVTNEIVQAGENLVSNIRNTEEIVKAILDANRNALMLLELRFSVWTLGLGAGTFIAALYGMNLKNFIEESDLGFWGISGICSVASVFVLVYGLNRLRRVQRVSMWGDISPPQLPTRALSGPQAMQEMRESLLAEDRAGLWGMARSSAQQQAARMAKMQAQDARMKHFHGGHPNGPLWSKADHGLEGKKKGPSEPGHLDNN